MEIEAISPEGPEDMVAYRDLVTVRRYRDLSEAIIARAVVESAGIFCFLKDENYIRLDWQMSNLIGGIRLQVAPEDVQSAEEILSQPVPDNIVTERSAGVCAAALPTMHLTRHQVGAAGKKGCTYVSLPVFASDATRFRVLALQ